MSVAGVARFWCGVGAVAIQLWYRSDLDVAWVQLRFRRGSGIALVRFGCGSAAILMRLCFGSGVVWAWF